MPEPFDMSLVQRGARNRRTPYYEATQRHGPKGFTVYNHMYFPIRFDTFEAEFEALLHDVTIWDVAVERCLELEPDHPDGHVTLAGWHAEIVDKVGGMLAGLSFGAKKELAEEHYDRALALAPASPVPHVEKAAGLLLMYGESSRDEAMQLLQKAVTLEPADAMQALDIEKAGRTLAELPTMTF